ncbi:MAG: PA0069 family radical SAM protein [Chromatiales bacterium]|jgi:DNA repair photolyase
MGTRSLPPGPRRGRGAVSNPDNRYAAVRYEAFDDGWADADPAAEPLRTQLTVDTSRTVITRNDSPDVPFDRSINPYRGCEHGCVYCYARPSHAWLGLSPGLDFETRLFYKPRAAELLQQELARPGYRCAPLALGVNTDAYQPVERRLELTRGLLRILAGQRHPVTLVTKSALIERDLDILTDMAQRGLVQASISVTTLDAGLARRLEPRAAAPRRRLESMARLADAGVPVGVMVAPVIPALTDPELERILEAARAAGARCAGYVLLRLPHEVEGMFAEWLEAHYPATASRVLNRVRDTRGGRMNDPRFGSRMRGVGEYADLIAQRFRVATRRLGFEGFPDLDVSAFVPPRGGDTQLELF